MGYPPQKPCSSLIFHTVETKVFIINVITNRKISKNKSRLNFKKLTESIPVSMVLDWNRLEALAPKVEPNKEYLKLFFNLKNKKTLDRVN